jgi:hypothetical protein
MEEEEEDDDDYDDNNTLLGGQTYCLIVSCADKASSIATLSFMYLYSPPAGGRINDRNVVENNNQRTFIACVD